jgi:hypothetical protein
MGTNNNWKVLKLPVLIDRLSDMEQDQMTDIRASIHGRGSYQLTGQAQVLQVSLTWIQLTPSISLSLSIRTGSFNTFQLLLAFMFLLNDSLLLFVRNFGMCRFVNWGRNTFSVKSSASVTSTVPIVSNVARKPGQRKHVVNVKATTISGKRSKIT